MRHALTLPALCAGLALGMAIPMAPATVQPSATTWALIGEANGEAYALDTGLTVEDCDARFRSLNPHEYKRYDIIYCEAQPSPHLIGIGCAGAHGPLYAMEESDFPKCDTIGERM